MRWKNLCAPTGQNMPCLPISKFGIMQLTRQRMRPEVNINTSEICPCCNGTGKITPTVLLVEEIEKRLHYLVTHQHHEPYISVHPILHSHLTKGLFFNSIRHQWSRKYKTKIDHSRKTTITTLPNFIFSTVTTKKSNYKTKPRYPVAGFFIWNNCFRTILLQNNTKTATLKSCRFVYIIKVCLSEQIIIVFTIVDLVFHKFLRSQDSCVGHFFVSA